MTPIHRSSESTRRPLRAPGTTLTDAYDALRSSRDRWRAAAWGCALLLMILLVVGARLCH